MGNPPTQVFFSSSFFLHETNKWIYLPCFPSFSCFTYIQIYIYIYQHFSKELKYSATCTEKKIHFKITIINIKRIYSKFNINDVVAEREHEDWSIRTYWPGFKKKKKNSEIQQFLRFLCSPYGQTTWGEWLLKSLRSFYKRSKCKFKHSRP